MLTPTNPETAGGAGKWTPGPWQNNGIDLVDGGPRFGASLFTTQCGAPISDYEMYANACLIASAPDLFEALADAVALLETHYPNPAPNGQINRARAAMNKARGL